MLCSIAQVGFLERSTLQKYGKFKENIMEQDVHNRISIMIVDDHPVWRWGLAEFLQRLPVIRQVFAVGDGNSALSVAREHHIDVILLDVNLPDINGLIVASHLRDEHNYARIVILTAYDDDAQAFHVMQLGCAAYCAKTVGLETIQKIIETVHDGQFWIRGELFDDEGLENWLQTHTRVLTTSSHQQEWLGPLSQREMEILMLVSQGLSNRQIAQQLDISYQTVKNHVSAIFMKLDVQDRLQAVVYAVRHGWVRLTDDFS